MVRPGVTSLPITAALDLLLVNPDELKDLVEEVEEDRINDVCDELGPIVVETYQHFKQQQGASVHDLSSSDQASHVLRQIIEWEDHLEDIRDGIDEANYPREVFEDCKNRYRAAVTSFSLSLFGISGLVAPPLIANEEVSQTIQGWGDELAIITGGLLILSLMFGLQNRDKAATLKDMADSIDFETG